MTAERDLFGQVAAPASGARVGRRVHLPAAVRAKAVEMRRQGASAAQIAEALGISEATAWHRLTVELERGMPGGRRPGRPRWQPTAEDRATVARLAAEGVAQDLIAKALNVSAPTLRRHCRTELSIGLKR